MPDANRTIPLLQPVTGSGPESAGRVFAQVAGLTTHSGDPGPPILRDSPRALYIHVPFCFHKCHYCDFYSFVDTRDQQPAFVDRLIDELRTLAPHAGAPLRTIFVGGGTPSLLRVDLWKRLLDELGRLFDLSLIRAGTDPATEFTVECNPETVTPALADALRAGGVDRVSMGAQSFNPDHLKTLERWHDPASVPAALETVRRAGISRTSIDLIFAIPGQSLADWQSDIDRALALGLDHLSCYNLTYEPNTAMTKRLQRGDFAPVPDDLEIAMYTHTVDTLARAGLDRYEVSNFARAGQQSRHNLVYWRGEPWLAAGPSASGYARGWRWKNIPRLPDYLESSGFSPAIDLEPPDAGRALRERLMMGLRLSEGLPIEDLLDAARVIHPSIPAALTRAAAALQREGLLEPFPDRWQLTHAGFLGADRVAARLMAAAHPPDA